MCDVARIISIQKSLKLDDKRNFKKGKNLSTNMKIRKFEITPAENGKCVL